VTLGVVTHYFDCYRLSNIPLSLLDTEFRLASTGPHTQETSDVSAGNCLDLWGGFSLEHYWPVNVQKLLTDEGGVSSDWVEVLLKRARDGHHFG